MKKNQFLNNRLSSKLFKLFLVLAFVFTVVNPIYHNLMVSAAETFELKGEKYVENHDFALARRAGIDDDKFTSESDYNYVRNIVNISTNRTDENVVKSLKDGVQYWRIEFSNNHLRNAEGKENLPGGVQYLSAVLSKGLKIKGDIEMRIKWINPGSTNSGSPSYYKFTPGVSTTLEKKNDDGSVLKNANPNVNSQGNSLGTYQTIDPQPKYYTENQEATGGGSFPSANGTAYTTLSSYIRESKEFSLATANNGGLAWYSRFGAQDASKPGTVHYYGSGTNSDKASTTFTIAYNATETGYQNQIAQVIIEFFTETDDAYKDSTDGLREKFVSGVYKSERDIAMDTLYFQPLVAEVTDNNKDLGNLNDYVKVTFDSGDGTFKGADASSTVETKAFWAKKGISWADFKNKVPAIDTINPPTGRSFDKWEAQLPADSFVINENLTYVAKFTVTEADTNNPTAKELDTKINKPTNAKDHITNLTDLPNTAQFAYETAPDVSTAGDRDVVIVVTYSDGSVDKVNSKVHVKTEAELNTPTGQDVKVMKNADLDPSKHIANKNDMPDGTTYEYKTPKPSSAKKGEYPVTVVVKYSDGSSEDVAAKLIVEDLSDKLQPVAKELTVKKGVETTAKEHITNANELDSESGDPITYFYTNHNGINNEVGDKPVEIKVIYSDGSFDLVNSVIHVQNTDKDTYTPTPNNKEVKVNTPVQPSDFIGNVSELPNGTTFEYEGGTAPSTAQKVKDKNVVIVVKYPDQTSETVTSKLTVYDDSDKYTPTASPVTKYLKEALDPKEHITNANDMPAGTTYEYKDPKPTTDQKGRKSVVIVVKYPDNSTDEVNSTLDVKALADEKQPAKTTKEVFVGDPVPNAKDFITNQADLGDETTYEYVETPSTSSEGDKTVTIKVTYKDTSTETVITTLKVKPKPVTTTQADENNPQSQNLEVKVGNNPAGPQAFIANQSELNNVSEYKYVNENGQVTDDPDTTTAGEKPVRIKVIYNDNSFDIVDAILTVTPESTEADVKTPNAEAVTVNIGDTPNAGDHITNKDELGATYEYVSAPDTSSAGNKPVQIKVTYSDGSSETVASEVIVNPAPAPTPTPTEADSKTPTVKTLEVYVNDNAPDAGDYITNKDALGATYAYQTAPDTSTANRVRVTIVVTYADESTETVDSYLIVKARPLEADTKQPTVVPLTVNVGDTPVVDDHITNKDALGNATYAYQTAPDTSTPGTKAVVIVVTYSDGSKDTVNSTVQVKAKPVEADSKQPTVVPLTVNVGDTPVVDDHITNKDALGNATYAYQTAPDTSTPGIKSVVIVVTYSDGSKDTVNSIVKVVVKKTDAEKVAANDPVPTPVVDKNNLTDDEKAQVKKAVEDANKDNFPSGTTVTVANDGTVTITYPDKSTDTISKYKTVTMKDTRKDADKYAAKDPVPTRVVDKTNLTDAEKEKVIKAVEDANKGNFPSGTTVTVANDGTVTITYPDKSTDTIHRYKTVYTLNSGSGDNGSGDNDNSGTVPGINVPTNDDFNYDSVVVDPSSNDSNPENKTLPATGTTDVFGLTLALITSGLGLVFISKKKN